MTRTQPSTLARRLTAFALALVLVAGCVYGWQPLAATAVPASQEGTSTSGSQDSSATVDPRVVDALNRMAAFKAELEALDRELGIAAEAYNAAQIELGALQEDVEQTKTDLANAEVAYRVQRDEMKARMRDLYRNSALDPLEVIFGSKSVTDLVGRIRYLAEIGESTTDAVTALQAQRDHMRDTSEELGQNEQRSKEIKFTLEARKIEVELRIAEREAKLAAVEVDLLQLLNADDAARAAEEAALMRDILQGANKAGIDLTPGGVVETALAYAGIPYVWAGETPSGGFDCSGLVLYVFRQHGVNLPHYSRSQFQMGSPVLPADLRPGDVVFFGTPVYHVGIYAGGGYFIHAPRTGDVVKLSKLALRKDYAGARRYAWVPRTGPIQGVTTSPLDALND